MRHAVADGKRGVGVENPAVDENDVVRAVVARVLVAAAELAVDRHRAAVHDCQRVLRALASEARRTQGERGAFSHDPGRVEVGSKRLAVAPDEGVPACGDDLGAPDDLEPHPVGVDRVADRYRAGAEILRIALREPVDARVAFAAPRRRHGGGNVRVLRDERRPRRRESPCYKDRRDRAGHQRARTRFTSRQTGLAWILHCMFSSVWTGVNAQSNNQAKRAGSL